MANLVIDITEICAKLQAEAGTYAQLREKADNAELITGRTYVMTDFQTIYNQVITEDLKMGAIEPLITKASSASTFEPIVASALYPNDIIKYDITIDKTLITSDPCKGRIFYREDENGNSAGYDWRTVLNWDGANEFLTFNNLAAINDINGYLLEAPFTGQEFPNVIIKDMCGRNRNNYFLNAIFYALFSENVGNDFMGTFTQQVAGNNNNDFKGVFKNLIGNNGCFFANNTGAIDASYNTNLFIQECEIIDTSFERNFATSTFAGLGNCTIDSIGNAFQFNSFESDVNGKIITQALYPELFSETPCTIYQKPNGEVWYRYYDNTNTLIFTQIV